MPQETQKQQDAAQEGETKTAPQHADDFARLMGKPLGGEGDAFGTPDGFEHVQRVAQLYASSGFVPDDFRKNMANCAIGVQFAWRHGIDPLTVFQHLHIIHGRPGMDAQLAIALANRSGKFAGPIRHEIEYDSAGNAIKCTASVVLAETGEVITGSPITWDMVEGEGWNKIGKTGHKPKWLTMREHMFRFRSSVFLIREYLPEVLLGMLTSDEADDIPDAPVAPAHSTLKEKIASRVESPTKQEDAPAEAPQPEPPKPEPPKDAPRAIMDGSLLDDAPDDDPDPLASPAKEAPKQTEEPTRADLITSVNELCNQLGRKVPPLARMKTPAIASLIKTLRDQIPGSSAEGGSGMTEREKRRAAAVEEYEALCGRLNIAPKPVSQMSLQALEGHIATMKEQE